MSNNLKKTSGQHQKKPTGRAGFTLVELLVTMGIFLTVTFLAGDYLISGFKYTTFSDEQETAIRNARQAVEIMSKEIRGANKSENGSYPLSVINDQELEYYADLDNDEKMEKIRYAISGSDLIKTVTPPGPANDYSGVPRAEIIAHFVNNQTEPLFHYYDQDNAETDLVNTVRLINITIKINVTPERAPADYYVETDVSLRNLKSNL